MPHSSMSPPASSGSSGVSSFNTRTGDVTLSKTDVTGTGLSGADLGISAGAVTEAQVTSTVAYRASAAASVTSSASVSITLPAAAQAGDLILAVVSCLAGKVLTPPAGYTALRSSDTSTGSTNNMMQNVYYRIATPADLGQVVSFGLGSTTRGALSLLVYSGVNQSNPIDAHGASTSTSDSTTISAPSVTTTLANSVVVECFGACSTATATDTVTAPATGRTSTAAASNFLGQATADQATATSAGATTAQTATAASTGAWIGQTIALAPSNASADIARKATADTNLINTVSSSGSAQAIPDITSATVNLITLTAACTFTFPTAAAGKSLRIALKQDGTGSRTATWPAAVKWPSGTAPTLTTTAGKTDHFMFTCYDGTNWLGQTLGLNY